MNKDFKDFVEPLSHEIVKLTFDFLHDTLENKIADDDIMNLLISAHLSSLFSSMRIICSEVPEFRLGVEKFIKHIIETLDLSPGKKYDCHK